MERKRTYHCGRRHARRGNHASQGFCCLFGPSDGPLDGGGDAFRVEDVAGEEAGGLAQVLDSGLPELLIHVENRRVSAISADPVHASAAQPRGTVKE